MAKRQNDPAPAEDYISQLDWSARHRRYIPVRFEPKWKYKIVYRYPPVTLFDRGLRMLMIIGLVLLIIYFVASDSLIDQMGPRIFLGSVFGLIFTILFFAIRDASKDHDNEINNSK